MNLFGKTALEESVLIEGCKAGKRSFETELFNKYASAMLGICMRYARNKDEAEDIAQEGFVKVFLKIKEFRHEGSFEGWMKKIMVNTALNYHRNNLKHFFHKDIDEIEDRYETEEENYEEVNLREKELIEIIQSLPEGYRVVFNLYVFEEYGHKEIAESLGITESTSKSQLFKARRYLKKKVNEHVKLKSKNHLTNISEK
ncbi:MAG: sigma-70 family RNA polymerase sigma factor [Bacteroidales bacterium]|nr:sigma-70 family RNA polymerase sigma factor [Bacteroidales bacterium]